MKKIPRRDRSLFFAWGLSSMLHFLAFATISSFLPGETPLIAGSAGRSGSQESSVGVHFSVEMPIEESRPNPLHHPPPSEGVEVDTTHESQQPQKELPSEVKNPSPRNLESNDTLSAGDGGFGDQPAETIGAGDDSSNRFGVHLLGIQKKIQSNLRHPGRIPSSYRILLRMEIDRFGRTQALSLLKSSGDPRLDRIAIEAAQHSDPFEPYDRNLVVIVPVLFRAR